MDDVKVSNYYRMLMEASKKIKSKSKSSSSSSSSLLTTIPTKDIVVVTVTNIYFNRNENILDGIIPACVLLRNGSLIEKILYGIQSIEGIN
jgi:hypothetical protein